MTPIFDRDPGDEHRETIKEKYLRDYHGYQDIACIAFARDLMQGDAATFKAGYTRDNAIIAAEEIFEDAIVDWDREIPT